jgi:hypothetical protein
MTALTVTAANVSADQNMGSIVKGYQALSACSVGQAVYLDGTTGKVAPADADAGTTEARGFGIIVEAANQYGETSIAADDYCSVCEFGPVYGFSGMTPGAYGWVSKTAGEIDDTKPTSAVQRILGHAQAADVFFVNPGESEDASA